ncbi:MAG: hypothetical protein HN390_02445 [Anaerolineae bacterium]|jgi:hypothetical protein|nr:hypothetical protein [Anaerolineae bacterium]MBT7191917.1 hypothetical protein [Anaerolineae bacterium]MBT7989355.1 hypothetical protein [Anaerolineae bacterium]
MGPGHLALGFAAKPATPKAPLWVLLIATEVLDLITFPLQALGIESFAISQVDLTNGLQLIKPAQMPWSHGLFMSILWSLIAAGIAFLVYRDRKTSGIIGMLVFSHWILDFIVHPPHLPLLFDGSPTVGLALWTSGPGFIFSIFLEIALLAVGISFYIASRKRKKVLQK